MWGVVYLWGTSWDGIGTTMYQMLFLRIKFVTGINVYYIYEDHENLFCLCNSTVYDIGTVVHTKSAIS